MKSSHLKSSHHSHLMATPCLEKRNVAAVPVACGSVRRRLQQDRVPALGLTTLFVLWFCGGLLYVLPNNGGSGLSLSFNILAWIVMALAAAWLALVLPEGRLSFSLFRDAHIKMTGRWLIIAGALLWTLPLCWAPSPAGRMDAFPHVLALWGLLAFIWLLRRVSRDACQYQWLTVLWIAALLQALFGFLQVTLFSSLGSLSGSRPSGIFQQVNVLASFIATGFICLLVTGNSLHTKSSRIFRWVRGFAVMFLPFMLVLLQSRTGWLGAGCGALIWLSASNESANDIRRIFVLIMIGIFLGLAYQFNLLVLIAHRIFSDTALGHLSGKIPTGFALINKAGSNWQRWQMYKITWHLIMQNPWVGSGYGEFEGAFARQMLLEGSSIGSATLIHPHNELLFVWAEGGLIGLAGLLIMVSGVLISLWQQNGMRWIGVALLLPLGVHMILEYPLYQSVPHGMMLAILLSILLPSEVKNTQVSDGVTLQRRGDALERIFVLTVSVSLMIFMGCALQTQQRVTALEELQLWPLALDEKGTLNEFTNTFAMSDRIDYDRHVALLMRYNLTHDSRLLERFDSWAAGFLARHSDPNVLYSRLMIARALTPSNVAALCYAGHQQWPVDKRFLCNK